MACKAYTLRGLNNLCKSSSFGGIKEVLIANYDDISALTVDSGTSLLSITMKEGTQFYDYKLMKNTGSLTSTLNTSDFAASYFTNDVSLQFFKMETMKRIEMMALMMNACAVIVRDSNNKYWYLGKDNYVECTAGNAKTGVNASDTNGYELTLTDESLELPYEVNPAIIESLLEPAEPPTSRYLTLHIDGADSQIGFVKKATTHLIQYSTDTVNWTNMSEYVVITVPDGSNIYLRGIGSNFSDEDYTQFSFGGSGDIYCSGSLNYLWNYEHPESAVTPYCGYKLFYDCPTLITAPELPATTLNTMCYAYMFYGDYNMPTAPELPALSLPAGCYQEMFQNCSSLNYVKCMAINFEMPQPDATDSWLDGVAATGTFVKNINMTEWDTGINGIPEGWTIQNATIDGNTEIIE